MGLSVGLARITRGWREEWASERSVGRVAQLSGTSWRRDRQVGGDLGCGVAEGQLRTENWQIR